MKKYEKNVKKYEKHMKTYEHVSTLSQTSGNHSFAQKALVLLK